MKVGLVSLGMGKQPLDEVLRVARLAGCEAIELNGRATVHQNLWGKGVDYQALKSRIAASGVEITSLGGYCDFAQLSDKEIEEQVNQFVGYCEIAREMGIPVVRDFAGDVVEGHSLDEFYPRIVEGFKAVTARTSGWGLRIGIENHGRLINNGDQLYQLIQDVGSPILGMTLDTGNFCWAGHSIETAARFLKKLAPYTVNVHIKDGKFVKGEWVLSPAGRGDLDLAGLLALLKQQGYDGPVVSEYEGQADFVASTVESVAYLRGVRNGLAAVG